MAMAFIPWLAAGLNVAGTLLSMRKISACWLFWSVSCVLWLTVTLPQLDCAASANWGMYLVMNVFGFVTWLRQKPITMNSR